MAAAMLQHCEGEFFFSRRVSAQSGRSRCRARAGGQSACKSTRRRLRDGGCEATKELRESAGPAIGRNMPGSVNEQSQRRGKGRAQYTPHGGVAMVSLLEDSGLFCVGDCVFRCAHHIEVLVVREKKSSGVHFRLGLPCCVRSLTGNTVLVQPHCVGANPWRRKAKCTSVTH
jgi:hypothetical protein